MPDNPTDKTYMRIDTHEWLQLNRENQKLNSQIATLQAELNDLRQELTNTDNPIAHLQRPSLNLPLKTGSPDPPASQVEGPVLPGTTLPAAGQLPAQSAAPPLSKASEPTPLETVQAILDAANVPKFELTPQAQADSTDLVTHLIQQAPAPSQVGPTTQAQPSADGQPPRLVAVPKTNMPYDEIWKQVAVEPQHQVLLTPAAVRTAMIAIELGQTRKGSLSLIGITKRRYQAYEQQARQGLEPYQTLFDLMDVAEARLELKLTDRWVGHTIDSWQAAKELLSRRRRDDWGDSPTINLSLTEMARMNLDQLAEIIGPEALAFMQQQADELIDQSYSAGLPANTVDGEFSVDGGSASGSAPNRVLTGTGGI